MNKIYKCDYTPDEYSKFYSSYIKAWYSKKDLTQEEQVDEFKTFYTNFIKEIVLNFTTYLGDAGWNFSFSCYN